MQSQIEIIYSAAQALKPSDTTFSDHWVETGVVRLTEYGPKLIALSEAPIENLTRAADTIDIFTDGSAFDEKAGWGLVVCKESTVIEEAYGPVLLTAPAHCPEMYLGAEAHTNNTGELSGVAHACRYALHIEKPTPRVEIHSDSMYAINVSTGRWKPKKNKKIAKVSRALMRKLKLSYGTRRVSVRHVRAHTGIKNNERADANAKRGVHAAPTPWPSPRPSPAPAHAQHVPRPRPPPSDPPSPRPPPEPPP